MSSWASAARPEPTMVIAAMTAITTSAAAEAAKTGRRRATT